MSLVNYGASSSSDESDTEEATVQAKPESTPMPEQKSPSHNKKYLFSSLPPPKSSSSSDEHGASRKKSSLFSTLPPPQSSSRSAKPPVESQERAVAAGKKNSLFSSLPPPKSKGNPALQKQSSDSPSVADYAKPQQTKTASSLRGSSLGLPPPKKKSQPVKISLPSIPDPDSDEEDEPVSKKTKPAPGVAGLFASLPKPRSAESGRLLIPYTLTKKKPAPPAAKTSATKPRPSHKPVQPTNVTTATSNVTKPKTISSLVNAYDDEDDDEDEDEDGSFFALDKKDSVKPIMPDKSTSSHSSSNKSSSVSKNEQSRNTRTTSSSSAPAATPSSVAKSAESIERSVYTTSEEESKILDDDETEQDDRTDDVSSTDTLLTFSSPMQDAPLSFKPGGSANRFGGGASAAPTNSNTPLSFQKPGGHHQQYGYYQGGGSSYTGGNQYGGGGGGQYNKPYTGETDQGVVPDGQQDTLQHQTGHQKPGYWEDQGFQKMMGSSKRKRGKEDIHIIDVNADDQRGPNPGTEWLVKSMTEEKEHRAKLKKDQLPSSQSKRKHQITYLAHQAKEHELALKNQWANNRMTRKQTQAKYGF